MHQIEPDSGYQQNMYGSGDQSPTDSNSGSPPPSGSNAKFKRNYRACLNCRVRKVKCDLGPVDAPREGKCARCQRERKDCVFVESRRGGATNVSLGKTKRKRSEDGSSSRPESPVAGSPPGAISSSSSETRIPRLNSEKSETNSSSRPLAYPNNTYATFQGSTSKPQPAAPVSSAPVDNNNRIPSVTNILNRRPSNGFRSEESAANTREERSATPNADSDPKQQPPSNHFSTMEGALVFLAKAAGTIAKADERDNIDARTKHEQIEAQISNKIDNHNDKAPGYPPSVGPASTSNTQLPSYSIQLPKINPQQHGNAYIPNTQVPDANFKRGLSSVPAYMKPTYDENKRMTMPALENGFSVRPKASTKLSNIDYIGEPNGILSEKEAEQLIHLFFTTMHPFFPHIPKFLHSPTVLSGYPILLCAILTIASRYHPFENNTGVNGGVPRNIEVHDRLWLYVQRLISQTVWAEASTRSIGTIFAFYLFTEWNPRAIHWRWSDYANKAEDQNDDSYKEFGGPGNGNATNTPGGGSNSDVQNLAGLGAMRRSYRMAWMLIGSAVRLAQDMGFMEISSKTFLASHIAEINSVMNISRRSMLAHSLSEIDLDEDEISEEDMENVEDDDDKILKMSEEDLKRLSSENMLRFTKSQKAQIELLQIMSLGHESLYGYKAQLGGLTQRQNLSVLNIISPLINNWGRKYKNYLKPSGSSKLFKNASNLQNYWSNPNSKISREVADVIEQESFVFEFNYVKLYIYSLALSPSPKVLLDYDKKQKRKTGKAALKLDEMSKSAKYIEQAFNAANEMLLVAHRVHRIKMLRFMPVRWLTRIVRAVAFIVKCYLTITAHKKSSKNPALINSSIDDFDSTILSLSMITIDEIIQSIQRAAITLRDCSPDELHLCTRYSNVLMYLCSEMKTTSRSFQEDEDLENEAYKKRRREFGQGEYQDEENVGVPQNAQSLNTGVYGGDNQYGYSRGTPNVAYGTGSNAANPQAANSDSARYNPNYADPINESNTSSGGNITPSESQRSPLQVLVGDNEVMEWFMNNKNVGLDFVGPWTEMIEQQLNLNDQFNFDDGL